MKNQVTTVTYHRNGVCGEGFNVVLFKMREGGGKARAMLGIVFEEPGCVAVLDADMTGAGNVEFARGNSWRGDRFESFLRSAIKDYNAQFDTWLLTDTQIPFAYKPSGEWVQG